MRAEEVTKALKLLQVGSADDTLYFASGRPGSVLGWLFLCSGRGRGNARNSGWIGANIAGGVLNVGGPRTRLALSPPRPRGPLTLPFAVDCLPPLTTPRLLRPFQGRFLQEYGVQTKRVP